MGSIEALNDLFVGSLHTNLTSIGAILAALSGGNVGSGALPPV